MTMKWSDEYREFEGASGRVLVNSSPDSWCLIDCSPQAMRAAAEEIVAVCLGLHLKAVPGQSWLDLVRFVPRSGDASDVSSWIERCMVPSGADKVEYAAARLLLSILRMRGILLWPVGVAFDLDPWDSNAHKGYLLTSPLGSTEFESGLTATSQVAKRYSRALLMSCSPIRGPCSLSTPALLYALEIATRSLGWQAAGKPQPSFWLVVFREISLRAEVGDELGQAAAEQAEIIIQQERERRRDANMFGPFASRPDAKEIVAGFELMNSISPRKRSATVVMGQKAFLEYLATTYDPIPRLNEMTRENVIAGPHGFIPWLERIKASKSRAHHAMLHAVALFEELCDRGLIEQAPTRPFDVPSGNYGGSSSNKLFIPREVAQGAESVLMDFSETALRQGEELGEGDWRPVRDVLSALPEYLPEPRSLLPRGLLKPGAFRVRTVTLRTSDGRYARILDPAVPLILLYLHRHPKRTIQARMGDSGEADEMVPRLVGGRDDSGLPTVSATWHRNLHPLATAGRREGVIREIRDEAAGETFLGFWISSNKSQEGGHSDGQDRGFEYPFEDPVLMMMFWRLKRLNERINPADRMLSRDQFGETQLIPSTALKGALPKYVYLFRSAANLSLANRLAPPSHGVISLSYLQILDEAETRLQLAAIEQGDDGSTKEPNGLDRKIITARDKGGFARDAVYSLHGLRVTGLTNMVRHGVPFWAISRLVANHATFKMTMRYIKVEAGEVRAALAKAAAATSVEDLWREAQRAAACTPEELAARYVSDQPTPTTGPRQPIGFWQARHDGICPNGETACSSGGPLIFGAKIYGPVEGGARNCPLCRHFLTGPKFLSGQVELFNAGLFRARRQSEGLRELRQAHLEAESPVSLARLDDRIARAEAELDVTIKTLNARYRLLKKSEALAALDDEGVARPDGVEGDLLITRSSPAEVALNLRLTSELGFLDTVARVAMLIPEIGIQDAIVERNVLIDRLLDRDGYEGLCYRLPQPEAAVAGNVFLDGVRTEAGPESDPDRFLDDVAEGRRRLFMLDMDGIATEVSAAIGRGIPIRQKLALAGSTLMVESDDR